MLAGGRKETRVRSGLNGCSLRVDVGLGLRYVELSGGPGLIELLLDPGLPFLVVHQLHDLDEAAHELDKDVHCLLVHV